MFKFKRKLADAEDRELIHIHHGRIDSAVPPVHLHHGWLQFNGSRTRVYVLPYGDHSFYAHTRELSDARPTQRHGYFYPEPR